MNVGGVGVDQAKPTEHRHQVCKRLHAWDVVIDLSPSEKQFVRYLVCHRSDHPLRVFEHGSVDEDMPQIPAVVILSLLVKARGAGSWRNIYAHFTKRIPCVVSKVELQ